MARQLRIAFDVDDTLIVPDLQSGRDIPNYKIINIYRWFQKQGYWMIVWSGGGEDYANMWADKLGLQPDEILDKNFYTARNIDICFDDQEVNLATINIKI